MENIHWLWQLEDAIVDPSKSHINSMIELNLTDNSGLRNELVTAERGGYSFKKLE